MRYINYARRSSNEKSSKQVASIDDQLKDTRRLAAERDLDVVEELTESRTAKEPGRPVFNRMIEKIRRGDADAIVCWKLDRLSRNPIDAATLRWMMTKGQLKEIHTPHQVYRAEDNALITAVESAMAEQYIADLRRNVERGMRSKCEKGGFPLMVPSGYKNERLTREVEVDDERFPLLRRAWELLLNGSHTIPQIHDTLVNVWGYRGRVMKCNPKGVLTLSALYNIFRNPFYKGSYTFMGTVYTHKYPRMVSPTEWQRGQEIISQRAHKSRKSARTHGELKSLDYEGHMDCQKVARPAMTYTGLMTCATCGFLVTAEKSKGHVYYHCNAKQDTCTKRGMREEAIEREIDALLESITLPPQFETLALEILHDMQSEEAARKQVVEDARRKTGQNIGRQKEALLSLYLQGHLEAEEYASKKRELSQQEADFKIEDGGVERALSEADETIVNVLHFVSQARSLFAESQAEIKRGIAKNLAEIYLFNNGTLEITLNPLFASVRYEWRGLPLPPESIEPEKRGSYKFKKALSGPDIQRWCTFLEEYRTFILLNHYHLPKKKTTD